jgi:hypothetical protein
MRIRDSVHPPRASRGASTARAPSARLFRPAPSPRTDPKRPPAREARQREQQHRVVGDSEAYQRIIDAQQRVAGPGGPRHPSGSIAAIDAATPSAVSTGGRQCAGQTQGKRVVVPRLSRHHQQRHREPIPLTVGMYAQQISHRHPNPATSAYPRPERRMARMSIDSRSAARTIIACSG